MSPCFAFAECLSVSDRAPISQCARRNLKCVYPEASRRGMRPKLLYDRDTLTVPTIPAILS